MYSVSTVKMNRPSGVFAGHPLEVASWPLILRLWPLEVVHQTPEHTHCLAWPGGSRGHWRRADTGLSVESEAAVPTHLGVAGDGSPESGDLYNLDSNAIKYTNLAAMLKSSSAMLMVSVWTEGNVAFFGRSVGLSSQLKYTFELNISTNKIQERDVTGRVWCKYIWIPEPGWIRSSPRKWTLWESPWEHKSLSQSCPWEF